MTDVFISYSRRNAEFMETLYNRLSEQGVEAWVDRDAIDLGDSWRQEIFDGIEEATKFICILSADWWKSEICHAELKHACQFNKIVIPVIHQECRLEEVGGYWLNTPWEQDARTNWDTIAETNWHFLRAEDDFDTKLKMLVEVLGENQEYARYHANLTTQARRWEGDQLNTDVLLRGQLLADAEQWLADYAEEPNPPTDLHHAYVTASRALEDEQNAQQQAMEDRIAESRAAADLLQAEKVERQRQIEALQIEQQLSQQRIKIARRASLFLGVVVVVAVIAFVFAVWQTLVAQHAQAVADQRLGAAEQVGLGLWDVSRGDYEAAIVDYSKAIAISSDYAFVYEMRGLTYKELGEFELAIADYSRAIELVPDDTFAYHNRGVVYRILGDYELAVADYSQAIELDPEDVFAYNNRGLSYAKQGEYDLALADYSRALELDPEDTYIYGNRALAYRDLENYEQAVADYDRIIELAPGDTYAYKNQAQVYLKLGAYEQAIADYDQIIELNEANAETYYDRGHAYALLTEYEQAIADYSQAIELDPEYALAYNDRAAANLDTASPNCASAAQDIAQAEAFDPDLSSLADIQAQYNEVCGG